MIGEERAIAVSRPTPGAVPYVLKYAHFPYLANAIRQELAQSKEGLRILDVGCGPGNLGAFMGPVERCHWIGMDLWHHQLLQAREKGIYECVVQGNLLNGLPFKKESTDVIICSEVLMYLPDVQSVLAEFCRVMRTGGKLFVYNPITCWPRLASTMKRLGRHLYHESSSIAFDGVTDWRNASRAARISFHSFKGLISEIDVLNFHVVHATGFRIFRNRIRFLNRLEKYGWYGKMTRYLATRYPQLSSDLMVVARKGDARLCHIE